jgi:hypothetical protein
VVSGILGFRGPTAAPLAFVRGRAAVMIGVLRWVGFGPQVSGILGFRRPTTEPLAFGRGSRGPGEQRVSMDGARPWSPANARLRRGAQGDVRMIGFGWLGCGWLEEWAGTVLRAGKT